MAQLYLRQHNDGPGCMYSQCSVVCAMPCTTTVSVHTIHSSDSQTPQKPAFIPSSSFPFSFSKGTTYLIRDGSSYMAKDSQWAVQRPFKDILTKAQVLSSAASDPIRDNRNSVYLWSQKVANVAKSLTSPAHICQNCLLQRNIINCCYSFFIKHLTSSSPLALTEFSLSHIMDRSRMLPYVLCIFGAYPKQACGSPSKTMNCTQCTAQLAWEKKERISPSPYMHTASIWGETKLMKQPNHMQLQIFENQRCHPEFHTMRVTGHNIFGFLRVDFHYKTSQYLFGVS